MLLHIDVVNKIATYRKRDGYIVCGNSGYQIQFAFDGEWSAYSKKTARFIWNGEYTDVDFTGDICAVPVLHNITEVTVGVYAGNLSTTTPAVIDCYRSILCEGVRPSVENDHSYVNEAKEAADRAEDAASRAEDTIQKVTNEIENNPRLRFTTDQTLTLSADGVLSVNTATDKDRTLPITASEVDVTVGNIDILLKTI